MSIKIVSRGVGKSAVAAAAYRSGETIKNEYDGIVHDYTRKGGIVHTEIILPENAPAEYADRSTLWNSVEKVERYKTAQLAREIEIALPAKLNREQNIALTRQFVSEVFVKSGMCADVCIHDKGDGNPHAHIMLTMRPIEKDGTWGAKSKTINGKKVNTTNWNDRDRAEDWRRAWAAYGNKAMRLAGVLTEENVLDHRSYERQGIDIIPTIHLGPAASQMEKRGIHTERGDINRTIAISNSEIRQLKARIKHLDKWLSEEASNIKPPTLADVIDEILTRHGQSSISRLKAGADMFNFLTQNDVKDLADLENKVRAMGNQLHTVGENLKKLERRKSTLKEHITQSEHYKDYRSHKVHYEKLYAEYKTLKKSKGFFSERKAQKALDAANDYRESNRMEITLYETAEKYLRGVLQERFDPKKLPPIKKWREEFAEKTASIGTLYQEYNKLKAETAKVERIQRSVREILHGDMPERGRQKSRGMEL